MTRWCTEARCAVNWLNTVVDHIRSRKSIQKFEIAVYELVQGKSGADINSYWSTLKYERQHKPNYHLFTTAHFSKHKEEFLNSTWSYLVFLDPGDAIWRQRKVKQCFSILSFTEETDAVKSETNQYVDNSNPAFSSHRDRSYFGSPSCTILIKLLVNSYWLKEYAFSWLLFIIGSCFVSTALGK